VGDLQAGYQHGVLTTEDVRNGLISLGFSQHATVGQSQSDVDTLLTLYISKAETEASRTYLSVANSLFRNYLISETEYRADLAAKNFPAMLIDDDVAAIQLEHDKGRIATSAAAIKSQVLHHTMDDSAAVMELQHLGYSTAAALELLSAWKLPPIQKQHGLSQAKVLSYLVSGLLSPSEARTKLLATGLHPEDVDFLLLHPTASSGVRVHALTPGLVTTAFMDGVIDTAQLDPLFTKAGVSADNLDYYHRIAVYKHSRQHYSGPGTLPLDKAEIRELFKLGIWDQPTATIALQNLGYSADNAGLLIEITNKGPIVPPSPPAFPNVGAAVAYLTSHGYNVSPPGDQLLAAAEAMVLAAGYSYSPIGP
jgi:hypothetical protein